MVVVEGAVVVGREMKLSMVLVELKFTGINDASNGRLGSRDLFENANRDVPLLSGFCSAEIVSHKEVDGAMETSLSESRAFRLRRLGSFGSFRSLGSRFRLSRRGSSRGSGAIEEAIEFVSKLRDRGNKSRNSLKLVSELRERRNKSRDSIGQRRRRSRSASELYLFGLTSSISSSIALFLLPPPLLLLLPLPLNLNLNLLPKLPKLPKLLSLNALLSLRLVSIAPSTSSWLTIYELPTQPNDGTFLFAFSNKFLLPKLPLLASLIPVNLNSNNTMLNFISLPTTTAPFTKIISSPISSLLNPLSDICTTLTRARLFPT